MNLLVSDNSFERTASMLRSTIMCCAAAAAWLGR